MRSTRTLSVGTPAAIATKSVSRKRALPEVRLETVWAIHPKRSAYSVMGQFGREDFCEAEVAIQAWVS